MKLGIAGTGYIVNEILPLFHSWGIEVTALCGTPASREHLDRLCRENHIRQSFTDYSRMVSESDIDTVYVAVPNFLHYSFIRQALLNGKNAIVEKPMASNYREAKELAALAKEKQLYLFEAISTIYLPNYVKIKEWIPRIGQIKLVSCNFSQYSSRYKDFREGIVYPVFDPQKSGGALMDLNLYNIHYLMGLFGEPKDVKYYPNIECEIDTSGILILNFEDFTAVSIAAKDCAAPWSYVIQGTKGYILQKSPANFCLEVTLHLNDGTEESFNKEPKSRLEPEFKAFLREINSGSFDKCYQMLEYSLAVSKVQTQARLEAGICFPADEEENL